METFRKLISFFRRRFWLVLLFVVVLSYGQTLLMLPWQDDNALFFKLAHIQEPAGYLGKGIFGEGAYKYTAFFYYPIYRLFGYSTFYYFAIGFVIYFLSVLVLYKVVAKVLGEKYGKISSFLYACGYIASDGFIRLYNSVITSLSVILTSLLLYCYWDYFKRKKVLPYLLAVGFYFLAVEFAMARTHYLIAPIILFEVSFFAVQKKIRYVYQSALRLLPFLFIFYKYFIQNGDRRSQEVLVFIKALLKGDFSILYGYFSSLSNIFVPNWLTNHFQILLLSFLLVVLVYLLFRQSKKRYFILTNIPLIVIWYFISGEIYSIPSLNPNSHQLGLVYLGGVIFGLLVTIFFYIRKKIKIYYLLFCFWILINLASYSAYSPTVVFDSINRYLAHSFFALVLLLTVVYKNFEKEPFSKTVFMALVFFYGLGNLANGFIYQNKLINFRTKPVKQFYQQLLEVLPKIENGDILYFDVADDVRGYFADAFSVAQMPETTAIAWRYGIDRYDFYLVENYDDFIKIIKENSIPLEKIHTFFYSKESGLVPTDNEFKKLNKGFSQTEIILGKDLFKPYYFNNTYSCVIKPIITFTVLAKPDPKADKLLNDTQFPLTIAQAYAKAKKDFYNTAKVLVSSNWRERVSSNLIDQNTDTAWQADRVTWDEEKTFFGFDLGKTENLSRFIWINGFGNNTPTSYSVEISIDGKKWDEVAKVENVRRIDNANPNEIVFNPVKVRYIRMIIGKTLNSDSAGVSEAWVVPAELEDYSIPELEVLIQSPQFAFLQGRSHVNILWQSNSSDNWQSDHRAAFELVTDGKIRSYGVTIPCSGTQLKSIKLDGFQFPVILNFKNIRISYKRIN